MVEVPGLAAEARAVNAGVLGGRRSRARLAGRQRPGAGGGAGLRSAGHVGQLWVLQGGAVADGDEMGRSSG